MTHEILIAFRFSRLHRNLTRFKINCSKRELVNGGINSVPFQVNEMIVLQQSAIIISKLPFHWQWIIGIMKRFQLKSIQLDSRQWNVWWFCTSKLKLEESFDQFKMKSMKSNVKRRFSSEITIWSRWKSINRFKFDWISRDRLNSIAQNRREREFN